MSERSNEILDKATELFWEKGYQATSMRDVQDKLDMRPGSLYARFPGKSALFVQVIQHYATQLRARLELTSDETELLTATRRFLSDELLRPPSKRYQRQCLLINAMAERSKLGTDAARALDDALTEIEKGFTTLVSALQSAGQITTSVSPNLIATWLQTQFIGLRHSAYRAGNDEAIHFFIDKLMLDIQGQWPATP
ncbi:TetR/AcrR family transcriptional regulator [Salinimonas sp. HHU 13199]|uniref:TetR/AcrR family transcriptional regulator n=1 Tax=Salinimonas profundi TaxID=2729140 RepID=A0ABR8LI48_9ALTE|nr:TetR/AcrR family transcriptional regulator [Salinimonas profundi]MBD3584985.1 TetR/AcrR family transcriptional regulator [Salinimonas profundi]